MCTFEGVVPLSFGSEVLETLQMAFASVWSVLELFVAVFAVVLSQRHCNRALCVGLGSQISLFIIVSDKNPLQIYLLNYVAIHIFMKKMTPKKIKLSRVFEGCEIWRENQQWPNGDEDTFLPQFIA